MSPRLSRYRAVVIVDDEIDHALIAQRVLRDLTPDTPVEVMSDPYDLANRLLAAPPAALLLVDRLLAGIEAYPVIEAVTAARPDLVAVVLSAWLDEPERIRALKSGARDAAQKPSSLAGWRSLLGGLLGLEGYEERPAGGAVA